MARVYFVRIAYKIKAALSIIPTASIELTSLTMSYFEPTEILYEANEFRGDPGESSYNPTNSQGIIAVLQNSPPQESLHVITSSFLREGSGADLWLYRVKKASALFGDIEVNDLPNEVLVVKKAVRVEPDHFRSSPMNEELLLYQYKLFHERFQLWSSFNHPHVVKLYFTASKELTLFQEYCENGSLREYLEKDISEIACIHLIEDILKGMIYLHSHDPPVAHGLINPGKIYVGSDSRAKLGEFVLSQPFISCSSLAPSINVSGITPWMCPDFLDDWHPELPTTQDDMWSFGCTLFEMVTGLRPYHRCRYDVSAVLKMSRGEKPGDLEWEQYAQGDDYPREFIELMRSIISQCWLPAGQRPSAQALLEKIEAFKAPASRPGSI